jgi:hypothetical protein
LAVRIASAPPREPSVALDQLGRLRFEMLDHLGLSDLATLSRRLRGFTADDVESLLQWAVDFAKATLDRLLEQAAQDDRETVIWAEPHDIRRLVGQTLLFGDRYLAPDLIFAELLAGSEPEKLEKPLRELVALRPLVEAGIVVPVPADLATVVTSESVFEATEADLRRDDLVEWVMSELVVDGPTARSVALVGARDDIRPGHNLLYFHSLVDPSTLDDDGHFEMRALHPYDPAFNYAPWLAQCRRQAAAQLVQEVNREVATAMAFGGTFVTRAPFRARLLAKRGVPIGPPAATVWADVPLLPELEAADLVALSKSTETIEALRAETRKAFRRVEAGEIIAAAGDLVEDLERATAALQRQIRRERAWLAMVPAGAATGSLVVSTTSNAAAVAGSALGAVGGIAQYIGAVKARAAHPAFALIMARRRLNRTRRSGHRRRDATDGHS